MKSPENLEASELRPWRGITKSLLVRIDVVLALIAAGFLGYVLLKKDPGELKEVSSGIRHLVVTNMVGPEKKKTVAEGEEMPLEFPGSGLQLLAENFKSYLENKLDASLDFVAEVKDFEKFNRHAEEIARGADILENIELPGFLSRMEYQRWFDEAGDDEEKQLDVAKKTLRELGKYGKKLSGFREAKVKGEDPPKVFQRMVAGMGDYNLGHASMLDALGVGGNCDSRAKLISSWIEALYSNGEATAKIEVVTKKDPRTGNYADHTRVVAVYEGRHYIVDEPQVVLMSEADATKAVLHDPDIFVKGYFGLNKMEGGIDRSRLEGENLVSEGTDSLLQLPPSSKIEEEYGLEAAMNAAKMGVLPNKVSEKAAIVEQSDLQAVEGVMDQGLFNQGGEPDLKLGEDGSLAEGDSEGQEKKKESLFDGFFGNDYALVANAVWYLDYYKKLGVIDEDEFTQEWSTFLMKLKYEGEFDGWKAEFNRLHDAFNTRVKANVGKTMKKLIGEVDDVEHSLDTKARIVRRLALLKRRVLARYSGHRLSDEQLELFLADYTLLHNLAEQLEYLGDSRGRFALSEGWMSMAFDFAGEPEVVGESVGEARTSVSVANPDEEVFSMIAAVERGPIVLSGVKSTEHLTREFLKKAAKDARGLSHTLRVNLPDLEVIDDDFVNRLPPPEHNRYNMSFGLGLKKISESQLRELLSERHSFGLAFPNLENFNEVVGVFTEEKHFITHLGLAAREDWDVPKMRKLLSGKDFLVLHLRLTGNEAKDLEILEEVLRGFLARENHVGSSNLVFSPKIINPTPAIMGLIGQLRPFAYKVFRISVPRDIGPELLGMVIGPGVTLEVQGLKELRGEYVEKMLRGKSVEKLIFKDVEEVDADALEIFAARGIKVKFPSLRMVMAEEVKNLLERVSPQ
jgi:hypothetical protein